MVRLEFNYQVSAPSGPRLVIPTGAVAVNWVNVLDRPNILDAEMGAGKTLLLHYVDQ